MSVCLANASGFPTTTCTALAAPGSFSTGTLGFKAPSGTVLAANTTYLVVLDLGIELVTFPLVYSDDEDPGAAAGWSISDRHISRYVGLAWESDSNNEGEYRIAVKGRVINTDATLSGLGLSVGKLSPAFDSATETYAATVIHSVSRITVMPTLNDSAATVAYLDSSDAAIEDADADASGHQVDLVPGANAIRLRVTAEDGTTAKTYTVTVTRIATASTDATLSALALSAGKLSPAFAPATKAYTASVINFVSRITVAPTANHAGVMAVSFLNSSDMALTDADTTADGHQVDLAVGETAIKVRVTAEDDTTTETYTITVRRAAAGTTGTQTGTTLVSNIGQDDAGSALFAMIGSDSGLFGQQFTTGSNEDGYILMGITVNVGSISGSPTPTVSLRKSTTQDRKGVPGAKVLDLSGSITGAGEAAFTPSIGTMLDAATRYFVTISLTGGGIHLVGTGSGDEDANAADGWAIANHRVYTRDSGSTHSVFTIPLEIAVRGTPVASTVSADASLSDLTLSDGTLVPEFDSTTEGYTASVVHSVSQLTVTPTVNEATATVAYLNAGDGAIADADGTAEGHQVALTVGENTVKVKVTAGDEETTKTYTVTVTRGTAAADATLSGLTVSEVTLAPEFASATESYTASVGNAVSRLTVRPTASQSSATVSYLDGENATLADADGGTAGQQVNLSPGENTIQVKVTAGNGTTTKTYTVTVTRASSTDATLSGLSLGAATLDPEFATGTEGYTASVVHSVPQLTVTPVVNEATATVAYLDGENAILTDADGTAEGHQVALTVGENTIKVKVTAGDGETTKTYTVTVTRGLAAADATLSGLTVSEVTLAPDFASATEGYTATVANAVTRVTVTPTASQSGAAVSYLDGENATLEDADGATAGQQVNLSPGENTIKVRVTATDGTTAKTYTVTVTRASSTDATLSALTVSAGTLAPEFDSATEGYAASVVHSVPQVTVTPVVTEATATVAYLDGENATLEDADGTAEGHQVALTVGENTVKVKVTAGDEETTKTYTVTVTRGTAAADATLSGLTVSPGTLDPTFASTTEGYTASVGNAVSRLTVTPTASQGAATVAYLDGENATLADADGATAGQQVDLQPGENTIKVRVTATDGTTAKTYTVTVTRASSTDATLSALTVSAGTLAPEFASGTESYTASVVHSVPQLTVTPTVTEATATVAYLDGENATLEDADGTAEGHQVALTVGENTVKVKVTAGDEETTKTYTVTVTRGAAAADATLSGLTVSPGTLDPTFASTTESYTASVGNAVSRLSVTPTASQSSATVAYLDGENATLADADGATAGQQVDLEPGENTIKVRVTATDGTTRKTYTVTVTRRAVSTDAALKSLVLSEGMLDPAFAAATATYTASVASSVAQISVTPTPNDAAATLAYLDENNAALDDADADATGHQMDLSSGTNTIKVKVTAEDGATTKTYTVTVSRAAAAGATPNITISPGQPRVLGKADFAHWTLRREGDTASALAVTVTLVPPTGNDWAIPAEKLNHDVTFAPGSATATLVNWLRVSGFTSIGFSDSATMGGTLTARLGTVADYDTSDTAEVEVVVVSGHAWVVKLAERAYRFSEAGGEQSIALEAYATSGEVPPPTRNFRGDDIVEASIASIAGGLAASADDFAALSERFAFPASSFSADANGIQRGRATVTFTTLQDTEVEDDETLTVRIQGTQLGLSTERLQYEGPDGTVGDSGDYPVTIEDDEITVESVAVTSTPKAKADTYGKGEKIAFTVTFGAPVTVTGTPGFTFTLDDANGNAQWDSAERTAAAHVFTYTVASGDTDTDGILLLGNEDFTSRTGPIDLPSGATIDDPGGVADTVVDFTWEDRGVEEDHKVDGSLSLPGAPGSLTAVASDGRAHLSWAAVSSGGFDILRYEYRYKSGTGDYPAGWTQVPDGPDAGSDAADETFTTVTGLTNGDAHTFQLRAVNRLGEGEGAESSAVTPSATACPAPTYTGGAREVLVATMTAGTGTFSGSVSGIGFSTQSDDFGRLSATQFTIGSDTYTIDFVGDFPDVSDRFGFSLTSDPSTAELNRLAVHVCDTAFALADRSAAHGPTHTFYFNNMELGLTDGATRIVRVSYDDMAADATLGALSLSDGTLSPTFASATGTYTASVVHSVSRITVTPAPSQTGAAVVYLNGSNAAIDDADSSTDGHQVDLSVGANTIKVKVTAQDGVTTKTYTVTVTRGVAAADATLSGLTVSEVTLAPEFASATEGYTATVGNAVSRLTVRPTASQSSATVSYLDGENATLADADGGTAGQQVNLSPGENTIQVKVTAGNGTTTKTYTVTVTRASSTDATLSGLSLGAATLDPEFATGTEGYTASVVHSVPQVTVTPTVTEATATVAYLDGENAILTDADGTAEGHQVALTVGENTVKVKVTAGDGETTKTYTVTVTRGTAAADATLSGLTVNPGTLDPTFASTTEGYTASVGNAVSRLTVTPTASQSSATVSYLDGENATLADADGGTAGQQVNLSPGENTIQVKVTAGNGTTTKTYTVTVTRASSTDATLSGLTVSAGTLAPEFDSATEGYTASVVHSVPQLTVTPTVNEATATVAYLNDGDGAIADADGTAEGHQVALTVGENTVKVKVTAGDEETTKTYTVTVTRGTAAADATLSGLTVSEVTLAPEFASATESYTASVGNAVSRLTVRPTASQSSATVSYLDGENATLADADGGTAGQQVNLSPGENTIQVKVTAGNGTTTKTYTVTVTRASSTDATLSGLSLGAATLDPEFATGTEGYTASVVHSVPQLTVTPVVNEATATVAYLDGENAILTDADGTAEGHQVALTVGENTIKVKVTAGDGETTKTYTVTVTRGLAAADATLSGLTVSEVTLAPDFASATEGYTATVANAVTRVTVTPTASQSGAAVSYLDGENATLEDADGATAGQQVNLSPGENTIKVRVTATDGTTAKTYTVTVTRASSTDATLSALTVSAGTLAPEFDSATEGYAASVVHSVPQLTVTPTVTEATATVAYLDGENAILTDADGTAEGHQVALTVGENTVKVKVTAGDEETTKTYTVTVTRGTAAADATLSGLTVNPGTLDPTFASTTEGYTASVGNAVSRLTVTPTASQSSATVSYLDGENATLADADGGTAGQQVNLSPGENTIKVRVTATDGTTAKTYTVTVTRASSTDATLSGLTVSAGTLAPEFDSATEGYAASVVHSVPQLTVTPTVTEATATVAYLDGENATLEDADGTAEGHQVALTVGENTVKVKVTAGDEETTKTYTVTVTRGTAAADATLSGLTVSPGTLAPEFVSTTESYTATVGNAVSRLTVTPTASQSSATVSYLDGENATLADADGGTAGQQVNLSPGENTIQVKVTAGNGTTTKTYTVTVTRASSTDATLSGLTVSAGTLDPEFATGTEGYTASVVHSVPQLTVTPTVNEATATVAYLDGENAILTDADGTAEGHQVALTVGENTVKVKVTAGDEETAKTYTVTVTRGTAAADATLSGLTVSPGTLAPEFASTTESYTASVGNSVMQLTVTPTASQSSAAVSYLDGENATLADADGGTAGQQVNLSPGENTIKVRVTATDGTTAKTYTVTVTRASSTDATLSGLTVSAGTLAPEFDSATEGYAASVVHSVPQLTVTPTVTEATATVAYLDGENAILTDADGTAEGHQVALTVGENTVKVKVTAGDEETTKTYTVTVTRGTAAADATLSGLTVSEVTLAPEFASTTESYTATVGNAVSRLTVTPTASQSSATVSYLDGENATLADADGGTAGQQVNLSPGENTIQVKVTAGNGTTTKTYTVTVTRASSTDATLSGLTVSAGTLAPEFDSATEGYAASVVHSVPQVTVTPTVNEATATVAYLNDSNAAIADADGTAEGHQVALTVGENTVKVKVTAGDGETTKTYTVTVTRGTAAADATLSGLTVSPGTLAPEFVSTTESYTATVGNAVSRLTVTPTASQSSATVSYLDGENATLADADGGTAGQQVNLSPGENTIRVKVTAGNGTTTKTYTVTVTRASSTDATLSGLTLGAATLDPEFATGTEGYTASVVHSVPQLTVTPVVNEATATVAYLDGENAILTDADGTAEGHQVALTVGENTVKVKVTAGDEETTKTYTVTVTRAASTDATLSGLSLGAATLEPAFAPTTESYTASVVYSVSQLTVTPTVNEATATVAYLNDSNAAIADADDTADGQQVALTVGENTIKVKVTAGDEVTTKTYTVTVTRGAAAADATLSGLTVSPGTLAPTFAFTTERYTASVVHSVSQLTVTPAVNEATATVAYLNDSNAAIADADGTAEGQQVALTVGSNTIKVRVTAGDGATTKTYTVTVTRGTAAADATLSGLTVNPGTLDPTFASTTESYTASVATTVTRLTVTPTPSQSSATVSYLDGNDAALADADADTGGQQVNLSPGANTVKVKVTASDGTTARTYTVMVARGVPSRVGAVATGARSIEVTWTAPATAPSRVGVDISLDGETWSDAPCSNANYFINCRVWLGATATSYTHTAHVGGGSTRHYRIFADHTGSEHDAHSVPVSAITWRAPATTATGADGSAGDSTINVSWTAVATLGTHAVTGYGIEVSSDGSTWETLVADTGSTDTTYAHGALPRGALRHYHVRAIAGMHMTGFGRSDWARTTPRNPGKPVLTLARLPLDEVVFAHDGNVVHALGRYKLSWPAVDDGGEGSLDLTYQFGSSTPALLQVDGDVFVDHEGHTFVVIRTIHEVAPTVRVRARNYVGAACRGVEPCDGAGEWSDVPGTDVTPTSPIEPGATRSVTARFANLPASHDGSTAFTFELHFSDPPEGLSGRTVEDGLLDVSGGNVVHARRLTRGSTGAWEVRVEPTQGGDITISLPARGGCGEPRTVCVRGQPLSEGVSAIVPGAAFEASFSQAPTEHDGETAFSVEFRLSEEPASLSYVTVRDSLFAVTGGSIANASRLVRNANRGWRLDVTPSGLDDVTLTLEETTSCDTLPGVCTSGGRMLDGGLSLTVRGPVAVSVADAEVDEAEGATLDFTVTLSRASGEAVTVDYGTSDGTATAGSDYTATSGTLTFAAGETSKTVSVPVLDDSHDEGSETMTLTLSNPSGAIVEDGEATGTINNTDAMPTAWMVRFGRTVGSQVVDALTARLADGGGSHVTVAGIPLTAGPGTEPEAERDDPFGLPEWARESALEPEAHTITADDLLLRSAFHLSSRGDDTDAGPAFTAWGRVSSGGFEAEVDDVTMDGDVTTGLVGFDAEWERALAGVMLSRSTGDGAYRLSADEGGDGGTVESDLTGVYPYARIDFNARVSAWGLAGAGSGSITLHQEGGKAMKTDLALRMGAVGVKGQVLDGSNPSGIGLNVKFDALWVGTKSARSEDLIATEGDVTRVRLIVQGERVFDAGAGATFIPSAEVGLRHDGGDAETGTGLEVGAGVRYVAGALTVEGQVRALVAHEDSGYEEWGISGAIRVTPSPSGRGMTLSIAPERGHTGSAAERLWSARDARELEGGGEFEAGSRLVAEMGYGFSLSNTPGVLTPYAGVTLGDGGHRTVRTGTRWQLGPDAVLGLEATRQSNESGEAADEVRLRAALRF